MRTLRSLVADQAVTAIASIGLMVAFACGAFDLSVGGVLGLGIVMVTWLQAQHDFSAWMAVVAALVVGLVVGAVNGMIVTVLKVNSFIATLAMASITEAVIYGVSGGRQVVGSISPGFLRLGQSQPGGVPAPILYMAGVALIVWIVLEHTQIGRFIYAVGSNSEAARLSGIRTHALSVRNAGRFRLPGDPGGHSLRRQDRQRLPDRRTPLPASCLRRGPPGHHASAAGSGQCRRDDRRHLPGGGGQQGAPADGSTDLGEQPVQRNRSRRRRRPVPAPLVDDSKGLSPRSTKVEAAPPSTSSTTTNESRP